MGTMSFVLKLFSAIVVVSALENDTRPTKDEWDAAQKNLTDRISAEEAREKKMAAVNKAIDMLEDLRTQILKEGEEEAATYNKFSCFCKDTTTDRLQSIKSGEDEQAVLVTDIEELGRDRADLDTTIQTAMDDITTLEQDMKEAKKERKDTLALYEKNAADLRGAVEALENAIQSLKASKSPTLAQLKSISETVRTAAVLADGLRLGGDAVKRLPVFLLQEAPEVPVEYYKFKSDSIIKTLEDLLVDFKDEKNTVDEDEVESVRQHDLLMQNKTHTKKMKTRELEQARKDKADLVEDLATASQELSAVEATLLQDKEYTNELSKMCADKATTWDQRSQARADELSTLTQAIGIVRGAVKGNTSASTIRFAQTGVTVRFANSVVMDDSTMSAIEAAAEEAESPPSFVQVASTRRGMLRATVNRHPDAAGSRDLVVRMLKAQGTELRSTLLTALASKIASDPFAKVKTLIQELIERLLQQASNEATQKGWCDKALADAGQRRDFAAEEITSLNREMAKLEAARDRLTEDLFVLGREISEIEFARGNATSDRAEEKAENEATIDEAQEGLNALSECIQLLDRFYKTQKQATVNLTLIQGPGDDAPDSGFESGEAYAGAQSEAGGVLAMLDVMKSDFVRTVSDTEKAEAQAVQDHLDFMTETGKTLAQKEVAHEQKTAQKADVLSKYTEADDSLVEQNDMLLGAITELKQLKPTCIDTGMSYEDRVSRRQEEIDSLNQALCILGKYEQYGPDAAGSC